MRCAAPLGCNWLFGFCVHVMAPVQCTGAIVLWRSRGVIPWRPDGEAHGAAADVSTHARSRVSRNRQDSTAAMPPWNDGGAGAENHSQRHAMTA